MVMYLLLLEVYSTTPASSVTYCCSILQDTHRETIEVKQNMINNSNPSSQVGHPQGFLQLQCGVLVKTTDELIQFFARVEFNFGHTDLWPQYLLLSSYFQFFFLYDSIKSSLNPYSFDP